MSHHHYHCPPTMYRLVNVGQCALVLIFLVSLTLIAAFWTSQPLPRSGEFGSVHGRKFVRALETRDNAVQVEEHYPDDVELNSLKLFQVLFRHGARTPLQEFPTDPNKDYDYGGIGTGKSSRGQLIDKGKKQAYELGKYLRKRYDGYLSRHYRPDEVYAVSSDVDRTIMTAEMVLAGLFPGEGSEDMPVNFHPIPVHAITKRVDNLIGFEENCQQWENHYQDYLHSKTMKEFDSDNDWLYKFASEKSGMNITWFKPLERLAGIFKVQEENGLQLPDWARKIYPEKMKPAFDLEFTISTATALMKRLLISPLVTEMVRNMEGRNNGGFLPKSRLNEDLRAYHNRTAKSYLFSGHDTTISAFLNSFDLYDGEQPNYVSAVIIELHAAGGTGDDHVVKVFYKKDRTKPIKELSLPDCPTPCSFSTFKENYEKYLLNNLEWSKECESL